MPERTLSHSEFDSFFRWHSVHYSPYQSFRILELPYILRDSRISFADFLFLRSFSYWWLRWDWDWSCFKLQAGSMSWCIFINIWVPLEFYLVIMMIFFVVWWLMEVIEFIGIDWCWICGNNPSPDWSRGFGDADQRLDEDVGFIIVCIVEGVSFYLHSNV